MHCADETQSCTFSVSLSTNVTVPMAAEVDLFEVNPVSTRLGNTTVQTRTYVSMLEIMTVSKQTGATHSTAAECTLWFCLKAFNMYVADGRSQQAIVTTWNESRFEAATSAHSDEYVFVDIPDGMNTQPNSRYSVSDRSLKALRTFVESLTGGLFEYASDVVNFSSDWIEAMWQATVDLGSWIDKLSLSLTSEIRDPHRTDYEGSASTMANYVHVQWYWMVYPASFLISLYYLFNTILAGARDGVSAWKCDSLPMLFSRIDPRILALGLEKMDVPKGLGNLGKSRVTLTKDKDGYWTFEPRDSREEQDQDGQDVVARILNIL